MSKIYFKKAVVMFISFVMLITVFPNVSFTVNAAYENTHINTGNQREDIVAVAETQIGYHEGSNNDTKYNRWNGMISKYPVGGYGYPWCQCFVSWCANQAGISTDIIPRTAGTSTGRSFFVNQGTYRQSAANGGSYLPQCGDIIYFGSGSSPSHVGIVTSCDGSIVYTIEGNSSDQVKANKYNLTDSYVIGYGVPNYISPNPIVPDTESPVITNSYITQIDFESFRVVCNVNDNVGIDRVKMATWTTADQSDIIWRDAYFNGVSSWFIDIPRSDYRENADVYITHIYAYDAQNNYTTNEIMYWLDTESPKITNMYISEIKRDSFRVVCEAYDNIGIDHVRIATWTTGDQSDLIWRDANFNGVASWFIDIPTKDYRENSEVYISHIYVYDIDGNTTVEEFTYHPDYSGPEFTDVYLSEISDTSFRVVARVKDSKGIDSIKIATWTTSDQSDLIWREATNNGYGDYFVDVPVREHIPNPDVFISHIYAYNSWDISSTNEILYWYKYNVSFDPNGGLCDTTNKSVTHASTYGELPTPTREGYVFKGWFTDTISGTQIQSNTKVTVTSNQTLYAHWEKINVKGDINSDGKFNVADVVLLQKWLLAVPDAKLTDWKAADLCVDGRLDVFDLCLMKRMLVENS